MIPRRIHKPFLCMLLLLSLVFLLSAAQTQRWELPFLLEHYTLDNGLNVILSKDPSLPLVSVAVIYNVGSIDEPEGKSGMAYLMQNLMFQGSRNVGRMQHINFINRVGGQFNVLTSADKTVFHQTVPSNRLSLALWLESDRMNTLNITRENVERTKQFILDDIKYRKADDVYLSRSLFFDQLIFGDYAYSHPVFGFEHELINVQLNDVRNFYSTFYKPNNAVLCIVGDLDESRTKQLVNRYFQTIENEREEPRSTKAPFAEIPRDIKSVLEESKGSPSFFMGYRLGNAYSEDHYPLLLGEYLLLRGSTSRLYNRLIVKDRLASHVSGGLEIRRERCVFKLFVILNSEALRDRCQRAIESEFNKFRQELIPTDELEKAKSMLKADFINQTATLAGRATFLGESLLIHKTLENLYAELNKYLRVPGGRIAIVANKYFSKNNIIVDIKIK